jgi:hypothetical protein
MKKLKWLIAGIITAIASAAILASCEYNELLYKGNGGGHPSYDYFIFGHTSAFCNSCDVVCKIENGKLYGAINQVMVSPDSAKMILLPDSLYQKVKDLPAQLPTQIFSETSETIGSYWPDAGHYCIKAKSNGQYRHWYIEAGNNPAYLNSFVTKLSEAIYELRKK